MPHTPDEFGIIARYFTPLTNGSTESLGLLDDAALYTPKPGCQLVLTKDILTENVHFFTDDDPKLLAKKLLRVNLSDLAGKGAVPRGYLMGLVLPKETDEEWIARFAEGLAEDNREFGISLFGGDTVSHAGALSLSLTAIGEVKQGEMLLRSGARTGDKIYVSGTLGDSALGLKILAMEIDDISQDVAEYLVGRYFVPRPRVVLGQNLHGIATAAMDISDGLIQDLGHLCRRSNVGAEVEIARVPLSQAAKRVIARYPSTMESFTQGDDYELLFTVPALQEGNTLALAQAVGIPLTCIGKIVEKPGVRCYDHHNGVVTFRSQGYRHF